MAKKTVKLKKSNIAPTVAAVTPIDNRLQVSGALPPTKDIFSEMRRRDFPYSETTLAEYKKTLDKMTITDLQRHCVAVAHLLPNVSDRGRLVDRLEKEYIKKQSAMMLPTIQATQRNLAPDAAQVVQNLLRR